MQAKSIRRSYLILAECILSKKKNTSKCSDGPGQKNPYTGIEAEIMAKYFLPA